MSYYYHSSSAIKKIYLYIRKLNTCSGWCALFREVFQLKRTKDLACCMMATRAARAVGRLGQPLKVILTDYAEVAKDLVLGARKRPIKASLYLISISAFTVTWRKRPDYTSYINDVVDYANELSMCSEVVRRPSAQQYIDTIAKQHADGYLRYINLGLVAIILRRNYSPLCANYHDTCKHLQPRVWTVRKRVVDVGFWGRWRNLDREMVDFDINEEELEKSIS